MKKITAFIAVLAAASTAYAQDDGGGKFSHNAEYRVRYQYDQNITGNEDAEPTSKDNVVHRFKFGTTFKASEKLSATLTLLHNSQWGVEAGAAGGTNNSGNSVNDGIGSNQNMMMVQEAYGTWVISDDFNLKFGRGQAGLADGALISENDWQATPYSFEGVVGTYEHEAFQLQAWGVRFAEYTDTSATSNQDQDAEVNSIGFGFDFKSLPEFLNMANVHVLYNDADVAFAANNAAVVQNGKEETRYGLVLGGETAGVDYKVNYEAHTGKTKTGAAGGAVTESDREGMMYQVELGYSMPEMMNSRFYVLYHADSGDGNATDTKNETYDPYFYELHENAGLMDIFKWGNLTYISLGYTLEPMEDTMLGIHYHMFSLTETVAGAATTVSTGANGGSFGNAAADKDKLGDEIDLVVTKKYEGDFMLTTRLGMFMPGDAFTNDDTYTHLFLEGKMTF